MDKPRIPHKTCTACHVAKPLARFGVAKGYKDGYRNQCNSCRTAANTRRRAEYPQAVVPYRVLKVRNPQIAQDNYFRLLPKRYGLSVEEYNALIETQRHLCAICQQQKKLQVDHCHNTGMVRGLLCSSCNVGLGKMQDSIEVLTRAIAYLRRTR